jgi:hypothetical protein
VSRILDFNGDIETAAAVEGALEVGYSSSSRAIAILEKRPVALTVDGAAATPEILSSGSSWALLLPRGKHFARIRFAP